MPRNTRPKPPLDPAGLERLALRYVERYATTRARLGQYLMRKIRERGWEADAAPDPEALAQKMSELGYVDDRMFAEARANAMTRRGLGARRIGQALRFAGVEAADREAIAPTIEAESITSAIAFARRRRFGPFAAEVAPRDRQERQIGAMVRAGHAPGLARTIIRMSPGEDIEALLATD